MSMLWGKREESAGSWQPESFIFNVNTDVFSQLRLQKTFHGASFSPAKLRLHMWKRRASFNEKKSVWTSEIQTYYLLQYFTVEVTWREDNDELVLQLIRCISKGFKKGSTLHSVSSAVENHQAGEGRGSLVSEAVKCFLSTRLIGLHPRIIKLDMEMSTGTQVTSHFISLLTLSEILSFTNFILEVSRSQS